MKMLTLVFLVGLAPAVSAQTMADLKALSPAECTDACVAKGAREATCPDLTVCTDQCSRFCGYTPAPETASEKTLPPVSPVPGVEPGKTILVRSIEPTWSYTGSSFEVGSFQQGRVDEISADTLILRTGESQSLGTGFTNVDSLWVRHGTAGRGALYGALVAGAAFGLFATVSTITECDERPGSDSCSQSKVAAPILTLVAAGVGSLIGTLIGSNIKSWRLQYARGKEVASFGVDSGLSGVAGQIRLKF